MCYNNHHSYNTKILNARSINTGFLNNSKHSKKQPSFKTKQPSKTVLLWTDCSASFPFGKGSSGVLANCSLCGTEATLSFSAGPVCSSFSEVCAILHTLCWSRQHQQVCYFLLFSSCLTLILSSPPYPLLHLFSYLKLCGRSGRNCLLSPPVLSDYNGSPDTRFFWGMMQLMSWPDGERYLRPPQSLVVSLLLSLKSTLVFSRTGGVLSHQSIMTHRFPQFPLRNLCSLVMLAVSSLVYAATNTAFFHIFISLELAESRILPEAPVDTHHRTPIISFCTVQLWTLCATHSLATLCLFRPLIQTLESCLASGAPWSSAVPPSLGRDRVSNNNNNLPLLSGIQPAKLHHQGETLFLANHSSLDPGQILHDQLIELHPASKERLQSRDLFVPAMQKLKHNLYELAFALPNGQT